LKKNIYRFLFKIIPVINRLLKRDRSYANDKLLIYYCSEYSLSGGLTDKLKGILSAYQISKISKRNFKIICNQPFSITKIFHENNINWNINSQTTQKSLLWMAKHYDFIDLTNELTINKNIKKILKDKSNVISIKINQDYGKILKQYTKDELGWNYYFNHLFKFSSFSRETIEIYLNRHDWNQIIGVHCRFINLLEDKIENGKVLSKEKQQELMHKISANLDKILHQNINHKILLCTDSDNFLSFIRQSKKFKDHIIIIDGIPKHSEKNVIEKLALKKILQDFFMLGECKEVYSITYDEMYPSAFPKYAAKLKNTPFKIIT